MLYLVLFSAVFDLFYFYQKGDMYALTIFFIIGFLVSFFSKNMVVILILAIALTHLIRYGKDLSEGFEDEEKEKEEAFEEEEEKEGFEDEEKEKEEAFEEEKEEAFEEEEEKPETFEDPTEEPETFKSSDKIAKTANVVNGFASSNVDARAQTLIDTQQKLMKSMETLKPMLDKAEGFLNTVGSKKEKFTNLADAYGPLKR
jgi:FtsZ-interacting cell division protein ZipA